jgi:hypothetical protein
MLLKPSGYHADHCDALRARLVTSVRTITSGLIRRDPKMEARATTILF